MTTETRKQLTGRLLQIARGESRLGLDRVKAYREMWEQQGYELPPLAFHMNPEKEQVSGTQMMGVGGRLREIINRELPGVMACGTCRKVITDLNNTAPDDVLKDIDAIVANIAARASKQAPKLWQRLAVKVDQILNIGETERRIRTWVEEAVARVSHDIAGQREHAQVQRERARKRIIRGRSIRGRRGRIHTLGLTSQQRNLRAMALSAPPPSPNPFTADPVRNLIYHIWPVEGWRRHIERIKDLGEVCHGRRIIGVSTDKDSETLEDVVAELGDGFEYLPSDNHGQMDQTASGEVATFRAALPMLDADDPNSVTLYGHAKGVRAHTRKLEAVKLWTELMTEMVLLDHETADAKMAAGFEVMGAFRTFGNMPLAPTNQWHFAGSFYQFRTSSLLPHGLTVKGGYGGTEAWPGDHCKPQNAHCVFGDGLGFKAPYDSGNWPGWIDQQFEWEVKRIGGPRTEQHKRELDWLLDRLDGARELLVIGSKHGGLEHHIAQRYPEMRIVSVDIDPQADNAATDMHVGSSQDSAIQHTLRTDYNFDAVYIDGDHTLAGVTADWEFAKTLQPDRIYFHDIADGLKHRLEDCHVDKLWAKIKKEHDTAEKVVGCGWGGTGEVKWQR